MARPALVCVTFPPCGAREDWAQKNAVCRCADAELLLWMLLRSVGWREVCGAQEDRAQTTPIQRPKQVTCSTPGLLTRYVLAFSSRCRRSSRSRLHWLPRRPCLSQALGAEGAGTEAQQSCDGGRWAARNQRCQSLTSLSSGNITTWLPASYGLQHSEQQCSGKSLSAARRRTCAVVILLATKKLKRYK